jgi:hypothetical protein
MTCSWVLVWHRSSPSVHDVQMAKEPTLPLFVDDQKCYEPLPCIQSLVGSWKLAVLMAIGGGAVPSMLTISRKQLECLFISRDVGGRFLWRSGILHKNLGIPKIGNKKSTHQARFHSLPINHLLNSVLKLAKFRPSKLIRIHPNHQICYSVIRVSVIRLFGYLGDPNNQIWLFGSSKENRRNQIWW